MEENKLKIYGTVIKIYSPSDWGFDNVKYAKFLVKTDKKTFYCLGDSFPLFVGMSVIIEGDLEDGDDHRIKFSYIANDLQSGTSLKKFLTHVLGKKSFEKIYDKVLSDERCKFSSKAEETKYVCQRIKSLLKDEDIRYLANIKGLGTVSSRKLINKYKSSTDFEELYVILSSYGLSLKDCARMMKKGKSKDEIIESVRKDPFSLMEKVDFSFNKCDILWHKTGGSYDSVNRICAAVKYVLKSELMNGHTFNYIDYVINQTTTQLSSELYQKVPDAYSINSAIRNLIDNNVIVKDEERYYLRGVFNKEEYLRNFVIDVLKETPSNQTAFEEIKAFEAIKGIKFGVEQVAAINNSIINRVSVITGGPGTGKTSCLACVIQILLKRGYKQDEIALCAPTGKAAKRMMESINGQLGTRMYASTIHSLLQVDVQSADLDEFVFNERNKLPKKVVVIDETSMLDLNIAYSLISALKSNTKIVFVGDIEQLPPVGAGYFLRDIIDSKVPTVKLLEIHRQKGGSSIITKSQKIRDEKVDQNDLFRENDYMFVTFSNDRTYEEKMDFIVRAFERGVEKSSLDDMMVLTPINGSKVTNDEHSKRFGAQQISLAIQEKILPDKPNETIVEKNGWKFKVGSKVILTKNDNKKGLVNGEIGYIKSIDMEMKTFTVEFDDGEYELDEDNIENLRLAYAITVHKSQGSEWKNVLYVCTPETRMNKKPLVYTAITRAKKNLVIAGDAKTFINSPFNKEEPRRSRILN